MAFLFGDSFDIYGAVGDMALRYSGSITSGTTLISDTAFGTGQAIHAMFTTNPLPVVTFATNEGTIYGSLRLRFPNATAVPAARFALIFGDGSSNQCSINWYGDGSVVLRSGSATGTALATLAAGAGFVLNTWDSWQFKVVIDGAAGSIELRKNGSTSAVLSASGVNTRAGSSNSYANQVTLSNQSASSGQFDLDDLFFCSAAGAAPNTWPGDLRAVQQMPASTVQAQFAQGAFTFLSQGSASSNWTASVPANQVYFMAVKGPYPGTLSAFSANLSTAATGLVRLALYDATGVGGGPGNLLATSDEVSNPPVGVVSFPFSGSAVTITKGASYWVAVLTNVPLGVKGASGTSYDFLVTTYAGGFPASAAGFTASSLNGLSSLGFVTVGGTNDLLITTSDGDTSYVTSAASGAEDIYTLSAAPTGYAVVGVTYFVQWKKPDVGPRTAALMLSANGSADTTVFSDATLPVSSYVFDQAFLGLDPTSAAWTPTAVNGAHLGIKITV